LDSKKANSGINLGHENSLHLINGNLSLDMKYCWVDCFAFERILGQSDTAFEEGNIEKAIHLIKKAMRLYHGPFLPNDEGEAWSILHRHRLRSKFIRYTGKLGSYLQEAGAIKKALDGEAHVKRGNRHESPLF